MNKSWNVNLVGVLADEEYVLNAIDKQNIYINSQNIIQFFVKIISAVPDSFPNSKLVTCYGSDLEKWGFEDIYHNHPINRTRALVDFLQDNLIVFQPQRKVLYDHSEVYIAREIKLVPKSESFHDQITLLPLPVFSKEEHGINLQEFTEKLKNRKYIGRIENISTEPNDTPEYILWKNGEYDYLVFGKFAKHHYAHGGFTFLVNQPIKTIPFQEEWLDDCYEHECVMFVPYEIYTYISGTMSALETEEQIATGAVPEATVIGMKQAAAATTEIPFTKSKDEPMTEFSTKIETERKEQASLSVEAVYTEEKLMEDFLQVTREQGLLYDIKDLYNFHTAMKSSNLVILAGMSGTGKSKLVQAYGKALGLFDHDQMIFIPVRPSWSDDADLIGYADTLHMVYRPGDSGLINALMSAKENKKKLHIICFDEMNLARVEHYFSQFLSVLEIEAGPRRVLRLYNEDLENSLYNSVQYPPIIPIGDNVIFVGTVNLDESTYHFSNKVLDRANVISLNIMPFVSLRTLSEEKRSALEEKRSPLKKEKETVTFEIYNSFCTKATEIELKENELNLLWDIHQELQKVSKNIGTGPRIVRQIDLYVKNLPEGGPLSRADAIDLQVVQRILTKVRGPEELLRQLLGNYDFNEDTVIDSKLGEILDRHHDVSEFFETRNVIIQKAKELKINGYTL